MLNVLLSLKLFFCKLTTRPVFILELKNGELRLASGEQQVKFMQDCADIVRENKLTNDLIYGVRDADEKIRIKTSSEIPAAAAQRIRNVWSFYS